MKVISVIGITQSGKTTTIENIIMELRRRRYTVGTVKEIHFHSFKMDAEGTNTDRHKKAGAEMVTARGEHETDILYQEKLSINKILSFYNQDFVILEGVRDTSSPKILTAHDMEGIEDRFDETVFAISGRISAEISQYKGVPAVNSMTHIGKLVDLIEEKAFEPLPDVKEECCKACGYSCSELSSRILKGLAKREDCVMNKSDIILEVNGQEITMVPFIQKILKNAIEAVVGELDGYSENGDIEICIRK